MNLQHPNELLSDIADGLNALVPRRLVPPPKVSLACIEVVFITPDGQRYEFDLASAIDVIGADLYFDERGNWADATHAEVRTI